MLYEIMTNKEDDGRYYPNYENLIAEALSKVKAVDLWDDIKELISFNHIDTQRCGL